MNKFQLLSKFWKDKKIFLTGHTGFKGAWLSIFFNLLGAKVYGYALKPN
jgi:CDP-glucose 4,6-dehydratase